MPKTYIPPAISLLARRAPPAIARYQFRLNRRNGNTAAYVSALICLMTIPLKNAYGNQISEQIRCQKLSRTDNRLTNASILSYNRDSRPIGIREAIGGSKTGSRVFGLTSLDGIGI